jgi:hypothetical protein
MIIWSGCVHEAFYREESGILYLSEENIKSPSPSGPGAEKGEVPAELVPGKTGQPGRRLLLPLLRPFRFPTPKELAEAARRFDFPGYHYVPQDYVEMTGAGNLDAYFSVQEEPGYGDYIYNTSDLAFLKGRKYSKKRNLISQFLKDVGGAVQVKPMEGVCLHGCLELFDHWERAQKGPVVADIPNCERKAIVGGLTNFKQLEMSGVAVEIGGRLSGFAFGSRLRNDMFALNFEKADAGIKGLYQFLDSSAARAVAPQYAFINKENDLGLPGLRKAKESYFPIRTVKSYILTLRNL